MTERLHPRPDDLLEYRCPKFGIMWQWRVHSVHLGAEHQESLIEVEAVMAAPGETGRGTARRTWVPEPMTRNLTIVRPTEAAE